MKSVTKIAVTVVLLLIITTLGLVYFGFQRKETTLRVFFGAAAEEPWKEIISEFEKKTGIKVEAVFGGSGTLLSQIEISKMGDIYAPGSPDYMVKALKKGSLILRISV